MVPTKKLTIEGTATGLDGLLDALAAVSSSGWVRERSTEEQVNNDLMDGRPQSVFRWRGPQPPEALLFLVRDEQRLRVTNIVPRTVDRLEVDDYNSLIVGFARHAEPIATKLGLVMVEDVQGSGPTRLSSRALSKLTAFSVNANKQSGSSHSHDFERWTAFLMQVHEDGRTINGRTLARWLVQEGGWSVEQADILASEFEFAQLLLEAYDKERVS